MVDILDSLGIEHTSITGNEVQGLCPAHEERTGKVDKNPSWYINADTGAHICFSCQFKGNLSLLVAKINEFRLADGSYDLDQAHSWINKGGDLLTIVEKALFKPKEVFEDLVYISEASLAAFSAPPLPALRSRGLTQEAADVHQLLWSAKGSNWIIPQRQIKTGKLLGWQEKGHTTRYFNNYPAGVKKSMSLYGYQQYPGGDMIVVESPLDVVRLESVGITGGVAIYGSMVSSEQLFYIMGADRVIFALDNDDAGLSASKKMVEYLLKKGKDAWFFDYSHTDMKDIGGMSRFEIRQGVASAKHAILYGVRGLSC